MQSSRERVRQGAFAGARQPGQPDDQARIDVCMHLSAERVSDRVRPSDD